MAALFPATDLELAAQGVGITSTRIAPGRCAPSDGHLYVWVDATPSQNVRYIGKASSARRLIEETNWRELPANFSLSTLGNPMVASPVVSLLRRNSKPTPLRYSVGSINWDLVNAALSASVDRLLDAKVALIKAFIEEWTVPDNRTEFAALFAWIDHDLTDWRKRYGSGMRPRDSEIEAFLVRVVVRAGAVSGNAQFAGQWDNLIYRAYDTLAALAVQQFLPASTFDVVELEVQEQ